CISSHLNLGGQSWGRQQLNRRSFDRRRRGSGGFNTRSGHAERQPDVPILRSLSWPVLHLAPPLSTARTRGPEEPQVRLQEASQPVGTGPPPALPPLPRPPPRRPRAVPVLPHMFFSSLLAPLLLCSAPTTTSKRPHRRWGPPRRRRGRPPPAPPRGCGSRGPAS